MRPKSTCAVLLTLFLIFQSLCAWQMVKPDPEKIDIYSTAYKKAIADRNLTAAREAAFNLFRVVPQVRVTEVMKNVGRQFVDIGETDSLATPIRIEAFTDASVVFKKLMVREKNPEFRFLDIFSRHRINELSGWTRNGLAASDSLWQCVIGMEENAAFGGRPVDIQYYEYFFDASTAAALSEKTPDGATRFTRNLLNVCDRMIMLGTPAQSEQWDTVRRAIYFDGNNIYTGLRYYYGDLDARVAMEKQDKQFLETAFTRRLKPAALKASTNVIKAKIHYRMFEFYYTPPFEDFGEALKQVELAWQAEDDNFVYRDMYARLLHMTFINLWYAGADDEDNKRKLYDQALTYCEKCAGLPFDWSNRLTALLDAAEFNFDIHEASIDQTESNSITEPLKRARTHITNALAILADTDDNEARMRFWELSLKIFSSAEFDGVRVLTQLLVDSNFRPDTIPPEIREKVFGLSQTTPGPIVNPLPPIVKPTGGVSPGNAFNQSVKPAGSGKVLEPKKIPFDWVSRADKVRIALEKNPRDKKILIKLKSECNAIIQDLKTFIKANPKNTEAPGFRSEVEGLIDQIDKLLTDNQKHSPDGSSREIILPVDTTHVVVKAPNKEQEKIPDTISAKMEQIRQSIAARPHDPVTIATLKKDYNSLYEEVEKYTAQKPDNDSRKALMAHVVTLGETLDELVAEAFRVVYNPLTNWREFKTGAESTAFVEMFRQALKAREAGVFDPDEVKASLDTFGVKFKDWAYKFFDPPIDQENIAFQTLLLPFYQELTYQEKKHLSAIVNNPPLFAGINSRIETIRKNH